MHLAFRILSLCLLFALLSPERARGGFIEYHTTNIQFLKGWDYKLGNEGRTLITFEHANRWAYGDFFMFTDVTRYDHGGTNLYGEFSPRFSLSKISGEKLSYGVIKDVLVSTTLEAGKKGYKAYLYGGAVDFDLSGFAFATANLYRRDNPSLNGGTWQVTLAWKRPFEIDGIKFVMEGFADFAGRESISYHSNQFIVPRLLVDTGDLIGGKSNVLFTGVEWQYWHNKFGVRGVTESVPQFQIKWMLD